MIERDDPPNHGRRQHQADHARVRTCPHVDTGSVGRAPRGQQCQSSGVRPLKEPESALLEITVDVARRVTIERYPLPR